MRSALEPQSVTREQTDDIWTRVSPSAAVADELRVYNTNLFNVPHDLPAFPMPDEPHVAFWSQIIDRASKIGAWLALSEIIPQVRFPISNGISGTTAYRAMMQRGDASGVPAPGGGAAVRDAAGIHISLYATAAGAVPVIVCRAREDFETLVLACTRRNEPTALPASMGACMVAGFNNWARIDALWNAACDAGDGRNRSTFLAELLPQKALYQDRFILLSSGPYSSVSADRIGLDAVAWSAASIVVRRAHEAAHYFTRRVFGSMQNAVFDEILADYAGIVAARGSYSAAWFREFMGVAADGTIRDGGRLANYRGQPPLSDVAFRTLGRVVVRAADTLEAIDQSRRREDPGVTVEQVMTDVARGGIDALVAGVERTSPVD